MKTFCILLSIIALLTAGHFASAQTCNGELMKFQETFGTGARDQLAPGRTTYQFKKNGSMNDGDYALMPVTQGRPEWHNAPDHTGNTNGRMMVINASYPAGEFYRDTVFGVSSISTYNIYFYAMNLNTVGTCSPNPILPKLELIVESYNFDGTFTKIYDMSSGFLPQTSTPTWVKISGQFYLPTACTAVRYRIINNSTGGCGNDLAIDDITFSQCQPVILPATGLTLKGTRIGGAAELVWSTVSEINTSRFTVQKSTDDKVWKEITTVKASGTSSTPKEYSYSDHAEASETAYYRILSVDANGRATYSNNILIRSQVSENSGMSTFPNPFTSLLKVALNSGPSQTVSLRIFDINGKLMKSIPWTLKKGENSLSISTLDNLSQGMYFLSAVDAGGQIICKTKVLKW